MKIAKKIFDNILTDLMDRRGIKTQFQLVRNDGPREIWDELIASNESIIAAKLEPIKNALILLASRLDYQWYQTDPFPGCSDSIKKGEHHPWVKEIEAALALFEEE